MVMAGKARLALHRRTCKRVMPCASLKRPSSKEATENEMGEIVRNTDKGDSQTLGNRKSRHAEIIEMRVTASCSLGDSRRGCETSCDVM